MQTHRPGEEAEVDFGELWIRLAGVPTKVYLFALRLSYSGKAVHRAFASQGQEAFIEGHLHAFDVLGGMPTVKIRYDNLRSAVSRVLFGRARAESQRWVLFRSTMGFEAFYCMPGIAGLTRRAASKATSADSAEIIWSRSRRSLPSQSSTR